MADLGARAFRPTVGGDEQNRTVDPLLARQVLSQLSYTPVFEALFSISPFEDPKDLQN